MINFCLILILKVYTVSTIKTSSYYFPLKAVRKLAKQSQFNDPVKQALASRIQFCGKTSMHTPESLQTYAINLLLVFRENKQFYHNQGIWYGN